MSLFLLKTVAMFRNVSTMASVNSNYSQFCVSSKNCAPYSSQLIVLLLVSFFTQPLELHLMHAQTGINLCSFLELFLCSYSTLQSLVALTSRNSTLSLFKLNKITKFHFSFLCLLWEPEIAPRQNVRLPRDSFVSFFRILYYLLSNIWKQLFHIFYSVFWLFIEEIKFQLQSPHHGQKHQSTGLWF